MKIFVLTGKADKRILLYPLMHLCKYVGKTCVITDDPAIKRLYGGYSDSGDIDDVDIEFVASNNENAKERMGAVIDLVSNGNTYDFVIVSTVGYIAKNSVKTIALNTQSYSFLGWHVEEYKEKNPDIILSSISMYIVFLFCVLDKPYAIRSANISKSKLSFDILPSCSALFNAANTSILF